MEDSPSSKPQLLSTAGTNPVSSKFAASARAVVRSTALKLGTAAADGQLSCFGLADPFQIYLEGIPRTLTIQPYVVSGMANHLNLGEPFLRQYGGTLQFDANRVALTLPHRTVSLVDREQPLDRPSADQHFCFLCQPAAPPTKAQQRPKPCAMLQLPNSETLLPVNSAKTHPIAKGTATIVPLEVKGLPDGNRYLRPRQDVARLNDPGLFVLPGVYTAQDSNCRVRVLNLEDWTAVLLSGLELADACPLQPFHLQPEPQSRRVSELTHKPAGKLTAAEQKERRQFVEERSCPPSPICWRKTRASESA